MKKTMAIVATTLLFGSSMAQAVESTQFPANTTIRPYPKRDRVQIGGLDYVSPAQLHENEGLRARVGAELQRSSLEVGDRKSELTTPHGTAELVYGWERLTFGLGANYLSAVNEGDSDIEERFEARKLLPQVAYNFATNWTAGVGAEISWLDVTEKVENEVIFDYEILRPVAGLSFNTPRMEFGVAYAAEVQADSQLSIADQREGTLSLAQISTETSRAVYLPAMTTVFGRGNLTDNVSLMSSVSMARYDGNVDGAIELFNNYKTSDRLAAKVMGTYWTNSRSHISLAAEYKGAATSAVGSEEAGLGYRLVNLYGATMQGAISINRRSYIGLLASYTRGERDETSDADIRYSGREDSTRIAGFMTVKI